MRLTSLALAALLAAVSVSADDAWLSRPALSPEVVREVNSGGAPWEAGLNKRFEGLSLADVKKMCGTRSTPELAKLADRSQWSPALSAKRAAFTKEMKAALPAHFDARKNWPGCVHPILNQGQCGSCWSFGASEVLSDRFCIESNGTVNVVLSPESLVSCDWEGNFGCDGGIPQLAWEYMEWAGLLTYECFPYSAGGGKVPSCPSKCTSGKGEYKKYYAKVGSMETFFDAGEIQAELFKNGPVESTMSVYSDFMHYKSGVYVKQANATYLGGHAIKTVGWGHDEKSGLDYWIVANSWGPDWGIDGFFWIQRGVDMCGIDTDATAGKAYL